MRMCTLAFTLMLITMASGCGAAPDLDTASRFQAAEEKFEDASNEDDYILVAALYQEILDSGFVSGSVLYNQGNAWMQAGKRGHAIASYRQAKRHLPRDPYLDANLKQALAQQSIEQRKPLLDYVFFWQQSISYREKGVVLTALLAFVLLISLAANLGWQPTNLRRFRMVLLAALALIAISLGRDWYNQEFTKHGVVVASNCTARKGGSESYEPAFNQSLQDGTEFTVIQELNGWLNIQLPKSGECWIPKNASVTYPR